MQLVLRFFPARKCLTQYLLTARCELVSLGAIVFAATSMDISGRDKRAYPPRHGRDIEVARRSKLCQAALNQPVEARKDGILSLLEPNRFEKAIVDGCGVPRQPSQGGAGARLAILWECVRRRFHRGSCIHNTCIDNTPVLSF